MRSIDKYIFQYFQCLSSLVISIIPITIVTVPNTSHGVIFSPKTIIASSVANNGAVLNRGVAFARPTMCMLLVFRNLPKAKLNRPPKANQKMAIIGSSMKDPILKTAAKPVIKKQPGISDIQVPVLGLIYCSPSLTSNALMPQQVAAAKPKTIPVIILCSLCLDDCVRHELQNTIDYNTQ